MGASKNIHGGEDMNYATPQLPHTYVNGAGIPCTMNLELKQTKEFIELCRVRSDGRRFGRILMSMDEAIDLRKALDEVEHDLRGLTSSPA